MPNFKKELEKAKYFYFKVWRGNEKPCPAFNGEVVKVTRAGWSHIRFAENRDIKEITPRLKPLPLAKTIIENQSQIVDYRQIDDLEYWALENSSPAWPHASGGGGIKYLHTSELSNEIIPRLSLKHN